jgi:DNA-binding NarL/FixJ family response regulator
MIKTILLADKHDTEDFNAAMEVGIAGFLAKPFRVQECKCLLRAVSNGCRVVSSSAKMHWGKQFCGSSGNLAFDCNISLRQKTLLEMLAQGKTYKDRAQAYQVSKPTIHKWIHILYTKMGVHSGREAVACWGGRSR